MKRLMLALVLAAAALTAFALPTVEDVQAEVAKGNYAQAEEMMRGVVQAKPGSARAHYVYAEILAHDRRYDQAAEQAERAKAIDSSLQFTQPDKFRAFERLLEREQAAARRSATPATTTGGNGNGNVNGDGTAAAAVRQQPAMAAAGTGVPGWVWMLGLALIAVLAWRAFSGRRQVAAGPSSAPGGAPGIAAAGMAPGAQANGMPGGGYGPGYAAGYPQQPAGAAGRNWLGTRLAAAGGVAAGMMAERLLEGHRDQQGLAGTDAPGLHGLAPGLLGDTPVDSDAQRELDQRPVDFGSGDDWAGGDAGGGDAGASGSDDGW